MQGPSQPILFDVFLQIAVADGSSATGKLTAKLRALLDKLVRQLHQPLLLSHPYPRT